MSVEAHIRTLIGVRKPRMLFQTWSFLIFILFGLSPLLPREGDQAQTPRICWPYPTSSTPGSAPLYLVPIAYATVVDYLVARPHRPIPSGKAPWLFVSIANSLAPARALQVRDIHHRQRQRPAFGPGHFLCPTHPGACCCRPACRSSSSSPWRYVIDCYRGQDRAGNQPRDICGLRSPFSTTAGRALSKRADQVAAPIAREFEDHRQRLL